MKLSNLLKYIISIIILITPICLPSTSEASCNGSTPLIMVPGTHAKQNRFDATFKKLHVQRQNVLKLIVTKSNHIVTQGTYNVENPIIVVSFETPDEYNIHQQANWFAHALSYLHQKYCMDNYNYVGHSNGGLVMLDYLEHHQNSIPRLKSLITIGTPFNDIYQTAQTNTSVISRKHVAKSSKLSSEFSNYYSNRHKITKSIRVTLIIGHTAQTHSDGVVDLHSAMAGQTILGSRVIKVKQVAGTSGQHSQLPTSQAVLASINHLINHQQTSVAVSQSLSRQHYLKKRSNCYSFKNSSLMA